MDKLAEAVKLAAKIREESYNKGAADQAVQSATGVIDFNRFYTITLEDAADKAAEKVGFDTRGSLPVYLLLKYTWNDILDWAKQF